MQSKATTVAAYLAALSADRRAVIEAVRKVILANLDAGFEEGMQYGMIGYYIPHRLYPAGYHCDPKQPVPFAALASQKNYLSLYLLSVYANSANEQWFKAAWAKTGKKLDMGKCCVRFKRLEDLPLEVIGQLFRRSTVKKYLAGYEQALAGTRGRSASSKPQPAAKAAVKKSAKAAPKPAAPAKTTRRTTRTAKRGTR